MKVGVYLPGNNDEHVEVLTAFHTGLLARGFDSCLYDVENYQAHLDLAVVFGVGKKAVPYSMHRGHVIAEQKLQEKNTVVLEKGYVKRDIYYAAGLNGLNGNADFNNEVSNSKRWEKLETTLQPWKVKHDGPVLLCGQVPWDASVQHTDHIAWCAQTVAWLHSMNFDVIFRPHPLALQATPSMLGTIQSNRSLAEDFKRCRSVVTFNSNTGVDALIAGVASFCADEGSMIHRYTPTATSKALIKNVVMDRQQFAYDIAYAQWSKEEMEEGLAASHLLGEAYAG
jgi:hypothetical protein